MKKAIFGIEDSWNQYMARMDGIAARQGIRAVLKEMFGVRKDDKDNAGAERK